MCRVTTGLIARSRHFPELLRREGGGGDSAILRSHGHSPRASSLLWLPSLPRCTYRTSSRLSFPWAFSVVIPGPVTAALPGALCAPGTQRAGEGKRRAEGGGPPRPAVPTACPGAAAEDRERPRVNAGFRRLPQAHMSDTTRHKGNVGFRATDLDRGSTWKRAPSPGSALAGRCPEPFWGSWAQSLSPLCFPAESPPSALTQVGQLGASRPPFSSFLPHPPDRISLHVLQMPLCKGHAPSRPVRSQPSRRLSGLRRPSVGLRYKPLTSSLHLALPEA